MALVVDVTATSDDLALAEAQQVIDRYKMPSSRPVRLLLPDGFRVGIEHLVSTSAAGNTVIVAEVHSDDRALEIAFDAAPWFAEASDSKILALARIEWGGGVAADEVALSMKAKNPDIDDFFNCLSIVNRHRLNSIGFEVHVNPAAALAWLASNRPELHLPITERARVR